jgi:hypothetical protein
METSAQTCARLVSALEDLMSQEAATLEARDFPAAIALQNRAAPLIEHLVTHEAEIVDRGLRQRILALIVRRNKTGEWLAEQVARTRQELDETQGAQRRVAQVAPAYGHGGAPVRRQLVAVG